MLKAGEIAAKTSSKSKVINLLGAGRHREPAGDAAGALRGGEPQRAHGSWASRSSPAPTATRTGSPAPRRSSFRRPNFATDGESNTLTFSDFLNLFVFNTKYNVGARAQGAPDQGLLQSLAEPNLIAYNGQEASFLAGGEVPVPVVQGSGGLATRHGGLQGVRHPPELHADDRRRCDSAARQA